MRKAVFLLMSGVLLSQACWAQFQTEPPTETSRPPIKDSSFDWDKIYVGGGFGAQFGDFTFIDVRPIVGYWFTEKFTAGAGITYWYFEDRVFDISTNVWGGSVFSRYLILENVFAHAEYESLNGEWLLDRDRFFVNSVFLGGGYIQRFGNAFFSLMLLYNFNESVFSPYTNPVIRFNFGIGL